MNAKKLRSLMASALLAPFIVCFRALEKMKLVSFEGTSQLLSLIPGKAGHVVRAMFYSSVLPTVSRKCIIDIGTLFSNKDVHIEDNVYIGAYCIIGGCRIGRDTLIGSYVDIMPGPNSHGTDKVDTPMRFQAGTYEFVHIGHDCWIGNKSVIMRNIGSHSIIGAGSIVTKDIAKACVAAGNPAQIIKQRVIPQA